MFFSPSPPLSGSGNVLQLATLIGRLYKQLLSHVVL